MKKTILSIKKVLKRFKDQYDDNELEGLVLDSIIILTWLNINSNGANDNRDFLDLGYEKIKSIMDNEVFQSLRKTLELKAIDIDSLIPMIYENLVKDNQREILGIYYTPQWLVKYVVDNTLTKEIGELKSLDNLKVLEPACGAGMFLVYVFDVLYDWYIRNTSLSKVDIVKKIVEENIYAIDIDDKALRLCKYALYIKVLRQINSDISLNFNLYNADFLMDKSFNSSKFDFIIGNPPYLENRKINKIYNKEDLKKLYTTAVGRFDIYSLFIEKSLMLLKKNGIISFVLPGNLLTNNNFSKIRQLILEKTKILELTDLGEGIFHSVFMNMAIIILQYKCNNVPKHLIKCKNLRLVSDIKEGIYNREYRLIPQIYYENMIKHVFDINSSQLTFKLRKKVFKKGYYKINDFCEIVAGIATGNVRYKLLTRSSTNPKAKKILEGKNIDFYFYQWDGLYFIDDRSIIDKRKGEYATFMRQEFIEEEKILIRQTADRFICTYDDQGFYLLNTLYSLRVREYYRNIVSLKYVLGLLNSKLYSFLYRSIVGESGKLFPQVKIFHIQNSAIVLADKKLQQDIVDKVNQIISIKKEVSSNEALCLNTKSSLIKKLNKLVKEVDFMVYDLYNLSNEEIMEIEEVVTV